MSNVFFNQQTDDDTRRAALYDGELFVYAANEHTRALCELAREMCEAAFHPYQPCEAQHQLPVERYVEILSELKPKFIHHPECKVHIPNILREAGCDLNKTYFDVPRLRTACAGDYLSSGLAYAFKPHRDTWYSPPQCQLNWWLPVYEVENNNVMAFHPHYWDQPVRNSSNEFNYQDWNRHGRVQAAGQVGKDTRRQSEALEELQLDPDLRIVPEPGGLLIFSAAHLHSTVPNTTNKTRISIDFRTVHLDDVIADRGTPNLDSACTGTTLMDYLRGTDLEHVPERLVRKHLAEELPVS